MTYTKREFTFVLTEDGLQLQCTQRSNVLSQTLCVQCEGCIPAPGDKVSGYKAVQALYLRTLRWKAISALVCFLLMLFTILFRNIVSAETLYLAALFNIMFSTWQVLTLPTGRFGDCVGNCVDMNTGVFYHRCYGAVCTLTN